MNERGPQFSLIPDENSDPSEQARNEGVEKDKEGSTSDIERKLKLQKEKNFDKRPGRHTLDSKVVASREEEVQLLRRKIDEHPELVDFEKSLYKHENIYLIPPEKKDEAEEIAKRKFEEYVEKYKSIGLTIDNAVAWVHSDTPGAASNKMHIYDTENKWNTWTLHAVTEDEGRVREGKYLPKYVVAYHELMHVEETPRGVPRSYERGEMSEVITTLKTITLVDEIYKEVHGLPLLEEVDYQREIVWQDKQIKIGALANFYRDLERKHGGIGKALLSEESLNFISDTRDKQE